MAESGHLERDPVCGMMVNKLENQVVYRGVGYAFCSEQCRERFTSGPGLYIGRHGLLAPKQKGVSVIKRRCVTFGMPLAQARFVELKSALMSMMGVVAVHPVAGADDGAREILRIDSQAQICVDIEVAEISYDLLQATATQLECRIVELNATLSNGWGERLQRDFVHYLEQCELSDLEIRNTDTVRWEGRNYRHPSGMRDGAKAQLLHRSRELGR